MIDNQGKYKTRLWAINEGTGWVITPVTSGDLCIGFTYHGQTPSLMLYNLLVPFFV